MLPAPNLDDRRFQDLVDDAKRMVQARCPEWTDHNVSDPGVTLIETFAFMTDQMLYRLNRVPDRLYVAFLDLLGVRLHPATAARVDTLFWLSAPQEEPVEVPTGTEVATLRTEREDTVVFRTTADLTIPPRRLAHVATRGHDDDASLRRTDDLTTGVPFPSFGPVPAPGDVLTVGLDDAAPSCAVVLRFDCDVQGVGVDPRYPPIVWEAWAGDRWVPCDVDSDGTGGLNRAGDVVLHVPATHTASVVDGLRGGWLRGRVVDPVEGAPPYSASPTVRSLEAFTIGGTVGAVHAEAVHDEVLGLSEGVPGQVFRLERHPLVGGEVTTLEVSAGDGWETWTEATSFADAGPDDHVFLLDRANGEVHLPPAVRDADGSLARYGAVPPAGAVVRVPRYDVGGGPAGNVAAHAVRVLQRSVPFVDRVDNRRPALGGVAAETVDEARARGPLALRTRDRAVTAEDYETLARAAAPGLARVRCVPVAGAPGAVRVLVVPSVPADDQGRRRFEDLVPDEDVLRRVVEHLEPRRTIGTRVLVEPPYYQGVTVVARVVSRPRVRSTALEADALRALNGYVDPLSGGLDGAGWSFGRAIRAGEVFAVLQQLPGVESVEDVKLFAADPLTGERGDPVQRVEVAADALVFSYQHQVRVLEQP